MGKTTKTPSFCHKNQTKKQIKNDTPIDSPIFVRKGKGREVNEHPLGSSSHTHTNDFCDTHGRDILLCCAILFLAFGGVLAMHPISSIIGDQKYQDTTYFLKRQALALGIGLVAMLFFSTIRLQVISRLATLGIFACLFLLSLVFIPGLGKSVTSSHGNFYRWLTLGPFTFQPSEFSKIALICFLAQTLHLIHSNELGVPQILKRSFLIGAVLLMILAEPQYGTTLCILGIIFVLIYVAGFPLLRLLGIALSFLPIIAILALFWNYRLERLSVWLNPYKYRFEGGYQLVTSFRAFQDGGLMGKPLASGIAHRYLTYGHTDFALALFVEDFGWIGVCLLLGGFTFFLWRTLYILRKVEDTFAFLLGIGALTMIMGQALLNLFVVTGMLPITGVGLPFLSYGGSSLITTLILCGLLLNVGTFAKYKKTGS